MDTLDQPSTMNGPAASILGRLARRFLNSAPSEVSADALTAPPAPSTLAPMETKAVNPPVASSAHEPLLERLGFRGTVDDYVVTLRAPGVSKQDVAVLVMRSHAIVTVTPSAKAEKRRGNVVQLFPKNNRGKRCQLQFIDPVAQHGHTVSLKDGVLTLRFMKEKSAATAWAESVDVS